MVLERAARMSAEATDAPAIDDTGRKGMRIAASYLNGEGVDLMTTLNDQAPEEQMAVRSGMVRTLSRNIVLPRDEEISAASLQSLQGIQELSGGAADIGTVCAEINQILEQYNQHKAQVKQQLDDAIRNQLKQKLLEQGQSVDDEMSLNPAMHPQYKEEWARMTADLNNQYNQALDQRKEIISQRLCS